MAANWGLRGKSVVALLLACALALVPAVLLGWRAMDDIRTHFGLAYAKNFTLLHRQKILAPVSRELALSRRFAESVVTRDWLLKEDDPARRALFFREAEGYRGDFRDHAYFIIASGSQHYYFNDGSQPYSERPRYTLEAGDPEDAWYFNTLRNSAAYNINVNVDSKLNLTKVWFNLVISDQGRPIGLAGSGLDLSGFLDDFIIAREPGVTPMIVGDDGAIQAHPDRRLIAYSSAAGRRQRTPPGVRPARPAGTARCPARGHAPGPRQGRLGALPVGRPRRPPATLRRGLHSPAALVRAHRRRPARCPGPRQPLAMAAGGHVPAVAGGPAAGLRLCRRAPAVAPLRSLKRSAKAIAAGRYDTPLPLARQDEIGSLSKAFASMADQVRRHTAELEDKVQERTQALEEANREMAAAQKKIGDSLDYASLIQRAILPDRQLSATLGEHHFILWKPRDVVGGDFYVYREQADGYLIGVVDCAGHGVPGALMTMLARAAIDHAIEAVGSRDPAAILGETDQAMRSMLSQEQIPQALATNMDAGLVWVDRRRRQLAFAGAKISLYASDGEEVQELKGARRAIGDKRRGDYRNIEVPLAPGWTFYLSTDGFLDQAGGEHGFGFGSRRFADMLRDHARQPLPEQAEAFVATLAEYQGEHPQRDDITILSFRFD